MKSWFKTHIFSSTIILIVAYLKLNALLFVQGLRFRFFIHQFIVTIFILGIIIGLIQIIKRNKRQRMRTISYIVLAFAIVLFAFPAALPGLIFYLGQTETIAYIDGVKYSVHQDEFLDRYLYYYDYKNFFISGSKLRIEDDYPGCTAGDPIRTVYDKYGHGTVVMGQGG